MVIQDRDRAEDALAWLTLHPEEANFEPRAEDEEEQEVEFALPDSVFPNSYQNFRERISNVLDHMPWVTFLLPLTTLAFAMILLQETKLEKFFAAIFCTIAFLSWILFLQSIPDNRHILLSLVKILLFSCTIGYLEIAYFEWPDFWWGENNLLV